MIASVHIRVNLPKLDRIKRYHQIAKAIRICLHAYGIHSSTIQPEFADGSSSETAGPAEGEEYTPLLQDTRKGCLFECIGGGACEDGRCCDGSAGKDKNGQNGSRTEYGTGS